MLHEVGGVRLNVVEAGSPEGLPVVFLHGYPFSHRMWMPQFQGLGGNLRLIAPDVRGSGDSDVGDGQYTMELLVDDLLDLLDVLEVQRAVGCGLSMGGYILLRAVQRAPDRFSGVALCDTRSGADTDEVKLGRAQAIRMLNETGLEAFAAGLLPRLLATGTLERRPEVVGRLRGMILAGSVRGLVGHQLAMAGRTDTTAALATIGAPSLVIVGEEDRLTPPSVAREMTEMIPGAALSVIPEAGHLSSFENPVAFNEVLRPFLEGLAAERVD